MSAYMPQLFPPEIATSFTLYLYLYNAVHVMLETEHATTHNFSDKFGCFVRLFYVHKQRMADCILTW